MPLTEAQERALRLIRAGRYDWDARTGGARQRPHKPGQTPVIYRQTLLVLEDRGLVEYDPLYWGHLRLTEAGRDALSPCADS